MTVTWPKCLKPRHHAALNQAASAPRPIYGAGAGHGQWFLNGEPISWDVAVRNDGPPEMAAALRFAIKGLKIDRGGQ